MLILRVLAGSSLLALAAGTAAAQVTTVGTNRSEVQDNGRDNRARVENGFQDNDGNNALVEFFNNSNRADTIQIGDNNFAVTRESGDRNTADIRQLGFSNRAVLHQIGNGNGSSVDQYLDVRIDFTGERQAFVVQVGDDNSSSVVQVHRNNSATVMQGTSSQTPETRSNGGVSTIYQYSAGNIAAVTMAGGSPDAANRSHVEQTRLDPIFTNSSATVNINGSFNLSYLYQAGAGNVASHSATGTQNTILGKSYGNTLQSSVVQEGYRNVATLTQYAGDRNSSRIEQRDGGDRQVYVSQGGSDNSSTVLQRRTFNTVVVNQAGDGTISNVLQNGANNMARVSLWYGSVAAPNKSSIDQQWNLVNLDTRFVADVTIRGSANESSISQRGVRHLASVDMAGGGVGNDEAGRRRGNNVLIVQDETLANSQPTGLNGAGHTARVQAGLLAGGGVGTVTSIQQLGEHTNIGNDTIVRQDGQFDRVSVLQSMRFREVDGGAVANISARGFLNQIDLRQYGRQFAFITQGIGQESSLTAVSFDASGGTRAGGASLFAGSRGNNVINAAQYGDRNTANMWQEGTDNAATIWQKVGSSDNSIDINQGRRTAISEDFSFCQTICQFSSNAVASITQSSRFNSASTTQYGSQGARAKIQQDGTGSGTFRNIARIAQFDTSAEASILQTAGVGPSAADDPSSGAPGDPAYFAGGARSTEARIRQSFGPVSARIEQRGRGQYAFIDQTGANTASILQDVGAANATAIIAQSGSGNVYNVVQTQPGQYINVSQTGTNNSVTNVITRP